MSTTFPGTFEGVVESAILASRPTRPPLFLFFAGRFSWPGDQFCLSGIYCSPSPIVVRRAPGPGRCSKRFSGLAFPWKVAPFSSPRFSFSEKPSRDFLDTDVVR